jgi:hypothetical protein
MPEPEVHVLIPTHTPRHLGVCLAGLAWQTKLPRSVAVTCDTDDPAIGGLLDELWPRVVEAAHRRDRTWEGRLVYTFRPHQGEARPAQVRNNGLRALERAGCLEEGDVVVGIDGDIVLERTALAAHAARAARGAEVILGQRVCLDESRSSHATVDGVLSDEVELESLAAESELKALAERHAKFERIVRRKAMLPAWLARRVIRAHKPKLMSAHYAVTVKRCREVNGFDEEFTGYGYEDDDFGRRLHAVGSRVSIAIAEIRAYHLWHPTRLPGDRSVTPEFKRFARKDLPAFAVHGWRNPMPQPDPVVRIVRPGVTSGA